MHLNKDVYLEHAIFVAQLNVNNTMKFMYMYIQISFNLKLTELWQELSPYH
jgi:hypothetical protein